MDKTRGPGQLERFKEIARNLGADDDDAALKEKLGVIARQKPKEPRPNADKKPKAKRSK
jgi:hypothetical protein